MDIMNIKGLSDSVMMGLDELFTSDEERLKAQIILNEHFNKPHVLQAMANIEEAKHSSIFVSGWRPALGWLCTGLLAYAWIGRDLLIVLLMSSGQSETINKLPDIDTGELLTLVFALLGLGGVRTWEKIKGVARR
ncbi:hypothetical protein H0A36_24185 [Endozoicomonas sp. SM1973]|uniref:Holin of 3TMs, for gene-transfer release n=1 Tax=Spartinivicinus marinus TaxID=2994442 RepID=A0A853I731_9GAMM|nr:3TM-type holin [Spartinivicinus marinus]NYZ69123.1 hypothetical protein [Spartinivicinus marinus]